MIFDDEVRFFDIRLSSVGLGRNSRDCKGYGD